MAIQTSQNNNCLLEKSGGAWGAPPGSDSWLRQDTRKWKEPRAMQEPDLQTAYIKKVIFFFPEEKRNFTFSQQGTHYEIMFFVVCFTYNC